MLQQLYFEDFQTGQRFSGSSKTINDAHFFAFAGMTGDNHPIHYDDEYAARTRFGKRLAHGLLLAGMTAMGASGLSHQLELATPTFLEQSSRYLKPVTVGDTISVEFEVGELISKEKTGILTLKTRMTNQHGDVVLEGFHKYLLKRRPEGSVSG